MNEAPREQKDAGATAQSTEPSSPHFDDTAVADAQPVEPLPQRARGRFSLSSFSRQTIAAVIAFGLILIAVAVVTSLLSARGVQQIRASEPKAEAEAEASSEPTQTENAPVASAPETATRSAALTVSKAAARTGRVLAQPRPQNQLPPITTDDEGKPVARKVGEIRYGRSPDRP